MYDNYDLIKQRSNNDDQKTCYKQTHKPTVQDLFCAASDALNPGDKSSSGTQCVKRACDHIRPSTDCWLLAIQHLIPTLLQRTNSASW